MAVKTEAGFTLIETVAGLAVLLVLIGIVAVFTGPAFSRLPALTNEARETAEIAELQSLLVKAGSEVVIPWWWPEDAIAITSDGVRVHDFRGRFTTKEDPRHDLLSLEKTGARGLTLEWAGQAYSFSFSGDVSVGPLKDDVGRVLGAAITIDHGKGSVLSLTLGFSSLPMRANS